MYKNRIKIDAAKKKQITQDWINQFPSFKKTGTSIWEKRAGPILMTIGYEVHYQTEYRVDFSATNLLNVENRLYAGLHTKPKSRRSSITWEQHEKGLYMEAVEEMKSLSPLPLEGPLILKKIIEAYKNYPGHIYKSHHFEDPALIAAWAGKTDLARECLDWGMDAFENYPYCHPENDDYDHWYQRMLQRIADPAALQNLLEEEVIRYKMTKVPYQDIVIDI